MSYTCSSSTGNAMSNIPDNKFSVLKPQDSLTKTESTAAKMRRDPRVDKINSDIKQAEAELRSKHSWLNYQDTIGGLLFLTVVIGMGMTAYAYVAGWIPAWIAVVFNGFLAAVGHEIEHDLIHRMYFRKKLWLQNVMLLIVWMLRPNTINPLYRRHLHLYHHKVSGQEEDIEERLISNGMKMTPFRLLCMADGFLGTILRHFNLKSSTMYSLPKLLVAAFPMMLFYGMITYTLLAYYSVNWIAGVLGAEVLWSSVLLLDQALIHQVIHVFELAFVVWILPNIIRSFSLNFISSNLHYYGDVKDVVQQCQILNPWYFLPLNFFCCNFGSTHSIHHFVVGQPFYIRQLLSKKSHQIMKSQGVRHNDIGSLFRSNRFERHTVASV